MKYNWIVHTYFSQCSALVLSIISMSLPALSMIWAMCSLATSFLHVMHLHQDENRIIFISYIE